MDDVMDKVSGLLSDEESVRQLSELAKMFMSDVGEGSTDTEDGSSAESGSSAEDSTGSDTGGMPDIETILKLTSLAGAFTQSDKNADLLLALKPHLGEEKQKRVDRAVKLLKLIAVWNMAKESGLLKDIM
ncbi:MAG: hypothetical protein Q4A05_07025 [Ruminococcus sp.]|nr:hypothetical protein [Ruminococcus sp.]